MKNKAAVLLLLFIVPFSCKKDANNTVGKMVSATVIYTGELSLDGCGWLIKVNSTNVLYHPVNLSDAYKKDSLSVIIDYHLLNLKYQCSTNASFILSGIGIDAIRKK